jgi:3-deoxy-manno-octulosonate cytidylyltransferase (CMP-KDO synthetase)
MKFIGIIPARYQSTRFPGKPLALINSKPMIQWVFERSSMALDEVWVATDNREIFAAVESFGGKAVMTSSEHSSGTDRCAEAARMLSDNIDFDVIVNIQGDEPFIQPEQINKLTQCFDSEVEIATMVRKITEFSELIDHNKPKVIVGANSNALYFSRATIPFARDFSKEVWLNKANYWAHIGIYAYRSDILQQITQLQPGKLEIIESLEQLRWLENGYKIKVSETDYQSFGIDTPEDLQNAMKLFS